MEIWLDTSDLDCIAKAEAMGVLQGVTTNPSIAAKSGLPIEELLGNILRLQKGAVTAQVTAEGASSMIKQAEALYQFSNRILVKIPVTAEGLKAMTALSQTKIPVMATAVFDTNQVLLAARAKAAYIAPYYSKICEAEINGIEVLKSMLHLLHRYNFSSKLIAASLHSPEQVKECADMGTHAVTLSKDVFTKFIENHPSTVEAMARFAKDWKGVKGKNSLFL